jgi:hypothetical protein
VYVTIVTSPDGNKGLKRIRFRWTPEKILVGLTHKQTFPT